MRKRVKKNWVDKDLLNDQFHKTIFDGNSMLGNQEFDEIQNKSNKNHHKYGGK